MSSSKKRKAAPPKPGFEGAYPVRYEEGEIEAAAAEIAEQAERQREPRPEWRFAACRYCGQFRDLSGQPIPWGADYVEVATLQCSCAEAARYAREREKKRLEEMRRESALLEAVQRIEEAFEGAEPDVLQVLYHVTEMVYDRRIGKTTVSVNTRVKAVVERTRKGKIRMQRKFAKTEEWEAGTEE